MGGNVRGGKVYGKYEGLASSRLYEGRDLPVSTDFRSVLATVLAGNLNVQEANLQKIFPNFNALHSDVSNIVSA